MGGLDLDVDLNLVGRLCLAFLFLYRGATALRELPRHTAQLAGRGVPAPGVVLALGLGTMFAGGLSVALDIQAAWGAAALIVFTVLANYCYHHFWAMTGMERRTHLYIFCNNVAVIGGLLLVIASR